MDYIVAVVNVRYSFHPELDWSLNCHKEGKEEWAIGKDVSEAVL